MKRKQSVAARFSASAATYDNYAAVQEAVAEQLMQFAEKVPAPAGILEIGCGTGILTKWICDHFPDADLYAVDISSEMIARAKKKLSRKRAIKWLVADVRDVTCHSFFDLLFSSSSLHWIQPVENTFRKINTLLRPQGQCIFSCMVAGTFRELYNARRIVAPRKEKRVALPSAEAILDALYKNHFAVKRDIDKTVRVNFQSAEDFFNGIHGQGVTGGESATTDSLLSRTELRRLISYYNKQYRNSDNNVFATYEVKFILAQKRE